MGVTPNEESPYLDNIEINDASSSDDFQQSTETNSNNNNQSTETDNNNNQSTETNNKNQSTETNNNNQSTETNNNNQSTETNSNNNQSTETNNNNNQSTETNNNNNNNQSTETDNNNNQSTETNNNNQSTETNSNNNNQSTETVNNKNQFTSHVTTPHHSTKPDSTATVHQTITTTTTETSATTATTTKASATTSTETSATAATTTTETSATTATESLPVSITDDWLTDDDVTAEGIHPTGTWMQTAEDVQTSQTHSTVEESPSKFLVSLNRGLSNDLEPDLSMETTVASDDVILISTPSGLTVDNPTLEHDKATTVGQDVAFDKLEVVPLHGTSLINTTSTTATAAVTATTSTAASTSVQTTAIVEDVAMTTMNAVATGSATKTTWPEDVHTATTTPTSLNTTALPLPTTSSEMFSNRTEVQLISKAGTPGSARPVDTGASSVTYTLYKPTCDTTDAAVSMWLGFPVFWWVVVAVAFVLILVMILSCCVCVMTSKRRWRKRNQQRRGYLDDQLTSSFIQTYSNPEVTPSSRNNKNGKIPPRPLKKIHKGKSSYPKSYHLGPQLLPFPADAVRLKPSSPSTPKSSDNFKNLANGGSSTEDCFGSKDVAGLKAKVQSNRDPETTFGTWRKSGVAVFGGLVPGCKKSSASNLVDADSSDKKSGKVINDDDVFEEAPVEAPRDVGLTTFSYKNNTNGGTTSTFKS